MGTDAPIYRMDAKGVEAGGYQGYPAYPQQQQQDSGNNSCCTQLLLIGGAALCCYLCMQLCGGKNDNQSQTNTAASAIAPLATGCLANLCPSGSTMNQPSNGSAHYSGVDNQIITSQPPHAPANHYETRNKGFSNDVCRSMVAMLDADRSGKLGFEEFKSLWSDLRDWKNVFRLYDKDNSGTLDGFELRQALNSAGYHLNNHILNILMHRYGNKQAHLEFDDFIMCAVKLKTMILRTGTITEQALIEDIQRDQYGGDDRFVNLDTSDKVPVPLDANFFKTNESIIKHVCHEPYREYTRRLQVEPGTYCVIPNAHEENEEGDFLIRIFSTEDHVLQRHDEDVDYDQYNISKQIIDVCSANEADETDQVTQFFTRFAGVGGTINWYKLKLILDTVLCSEKENLNFSRDLCKSLLAMLDVDKSGELSLSEFQALWKDVQQWKSVFSVYDKDKSGALSPFELRNALNSVGFTVNTQVLNLLMQRFRNEKGELVLEDFIAAAVKLKTMINVFKEESDLNTGTATFTLDRWLQITLYN
ncbi:EF-hand domain pair [Popillia japonica]|uniref:EF-hand domain pair n=1 Tax=Popillia japonica TaxID=7064 RepID=A0AAW1K0H8_POPJA